MSDLPVPRKPSLPGRIISRQTLKAEGSREEKARDPDELIARILAMVQAGKLNDDDAARLIAEVGLIFAAYRRADSPPAVPVVNVPSGGSSTSVGGDVGQGNNLGPGTTNNRDVAGRDVVTNNVNGGVFIANLDNLTLNGEAPAPAPTAESEGVSPAMSGAERAYLNRLLLTAGRVPLGQLDLQTGGASGGAPEVRLESIYVPLDTTALQPVQDGKPVQHIPIPLLAATIRYRHLVILGDPGSGKSTFLNYLTLCLAGARLHPKRGYLERLNVERGDGQKAANWKYGPLLPLRVELREMVGAIPEGTKKGAARLLWDHIAEQLKAHGLAEFTPHLAAMLTGGQCLVMFDGLDEVPDKAARKVIREAISDFAMTYARSRIVVTCRALSYTDPAWRLNSFPDVTIGPLSPASIEVFISSWYAALARLGFKDQDWNRARTEELRQAASDLTDLARNPLLLTVMAVVHTYKGHLPRERARLYDDCVNLLLWNWQRSKQIDGGRWEQGILDELETREERLMSGLCEVAYHAHRAEGSRPDAAHIPQSELLRILKAYLDDDWGKAQRFCDYVEKQAGLLIGRGDGQGGEPLYAFPHRGFQEFLAGRHLVVGRDFARRAADLAAEGDLWHEVLMLAVGHLIFNLDEITRPLDAVSLLCPAALPADPAGWRAVAWAGEILLLVGRSAAEGDKHVGQQVLPRVIQHLVALVEGGHLSPRERAQAADALGHLGDPRRGVCTPVPELVRLEGGEFQMGADSERHAIRIAPFYLARYPVTNAQFRRFARKDYNNSQFWTPQGEEWRKRTGQRRGLLHDAALGLDNRPVVGITWHEAQAFANWLAKKTGKPFRLPSEAEWEFAAAGTEGRRYPWGSRASDDVANTREAAIGQTCAVGIFPTDRTPEGVCDLGGNVWEWTASLSLDYPYLPDGSREKLDAPGARILRGGAYDSSRATLHCTQRRPVEPHAR